MSKAELEAAGDGRFRVTGPVVFETAGELLETSSELFSDCTDMHIDLGGVTSVDSAALALLIEWLRLARQAGSTIQIEHVPEKLLAIARLSGVEEMLINTAS
jgi:phospholipid transport system transporter-binding protein